MVVQTELCSMNNEMLTIAGEYERTGRSATSLPQKPGVNTTAAAAAAAAAATTTTTNCNHDSNSNDNTNSCNIHISVAINEQGEARHPLLRNQI